MGLVKHKDVFSSKYNTAIIIDSNNRARFIPIKYVFNDFFMAKIDGLRFAFKIEENRMITYRETMTKSCHFFIYNTDNWSPLSASDVKQLEDILTKNSLPKVNRTGLKALQILSLREKKEFKEHDLDALASEVATHDDEYPDEVREMLTFFKNLETNKVITPVRKVTEYIVDDLIATSPQFMGSVVDKAVEAELLHKKINNEPITGKTPWLKFVAIMMLIGIVGGLAYYAYSSGAFSHMIPQIGTPAGPSAGDLMKQYPDPYALKLKIDSGQAKLSDYPPEVQDLIKNAKPSQLPSTPLAPNQH